MELFGTSLLQMKTSYMEKDLSKNDLVIVKKPNKNQLIVGNIIAYKVNNKIRIDKIYKIIESKGAEDTIYVTKSNKSLYPNKEHIKESQVIGKKVLSFPLLGIIIGFLQTKVATFLTLSFLLLILSYVRYKEIRYRERKKKKAGNLM